MPVYNAAKTLRRAIDGICKQTLKELEIIVVNDGSTDDSLTIAQDFALQDERIIILTQDNQGASQAKNTGLKKASGEYVIFHDSDDWTEPDMYSALYAAAKTNDYDVVYCDHISINGGQRYHWSFEFNNDDSDFLRQILTDHCCSPCTHLLRKAVLDHYNYFFPKDLSIAEDTVALTCLFINNYNECKTHNNNNYLRVKHLPVAFYYYDNQGNPNSLTKVQSSVKYSKLVYAWRMIGKDLNLSAFGKEYYQSLLRYAFEALWNNYLPPAEYYSLFAPYKQDIRLFVPKSTRRYLVLMAADEKYEQARRRMWLLYPRIALEKLQRLVHRLKGHSSVR